MKVGLYRGTSGRLAVKIRSLTFQTDNSSIQDRIGHNNRAEDFAENTEGGRDIFIVQEQSVSLSTEMVNRLPGPAYHYLFSRRTKPTRSHLNTQQCLTLISTSSLHLTTSICST